MILVKIGDFVSRKSHNNDVVFKVIWINPDGFVELKGLTLRLIADAPINDLVTLNPDRIENLACSRKKLVAAMTNSNDITQKVVDKWWQLHILVRPPNLRSSHGSLHNYHPPV